MNFKFFLHRPWDTLFPPLPTQPSPGSCTTIMERLSSQTQRLWPNGWTNWKNSEVGQRQKQPSPRPLPPPPETPPHLWHRRRRRRHRRRHRRRDWPSKLQKKTTHRASQKRKRIRLLPWWVFQISTSQKILFFFSKGWKKLWRKIPKLKDFFFQITCWIYIPTKICPFKDTNSSTI